MLERANFCARRGHFGRINQQFASLRPSAQRYSIATVRPSVQPSSRSRCTKPATHSAQLARVPEREKSDDRHSRLLRARRERPRCRRAADERG
jgi:hypothetical protein